MLNNSWMAPLLTYVCRHTCRAIGAAAPVHRAAGFEAAALNVNRDGGVSWAMDMVARLTCCCLQEGGAAEDASGTYAGEATDMLLEAWVELLADHLVGCGRMLPTRLPDKLLYCCCRGPSNSNPPSGVITSIFCRSLLLGCLA